MQSNHKEPKIAQSRKDDKTKTSVFISSNLGFTTSGHTDRFEQYLVHQIINANIIYCPSVLAQKSFFSDGSLTTNTVTLMLEKLLVNDHFCRNVFWIVDL